MQPTFIFMSLLLVAAVSGIISIAFFAQSVFGFGAGLLTVPTLAILLGTKQAIAISYVFQFCMGLLIFFNWRQINWRKFVVVAGLIFGGTLAGAYSLMALPVEIVDLSVAALSLFFALQLIFSKTNEGQTHIENCSILIPSHFIILLGALIHGLAGIGGPLMVIGLSNLSSGSQQTRAYIILSLFISNIARGLIFLPAGLIDSVTLEYVYIAFPFFLIAIWLGNRMSIVLSENNYRRGLAAVMIFSSVKLFFDVY